jgi:hypothetical protein
VDIETDRIGAGWVGTYRVRNWDDAAVATWPHRRTASGSKAYYTERLAEALGGRLDRREFARVWDLCWSHVADHELLWSKVRTKAWSSAMSFMNLRA